MTICIARFCETATPLMRSYVSNVRQRNAFSSSA